MSGAFQNDAFQGIGFQIDYEVALNATENSDVASFAISATTTAEFTAVENKDVASFELEVISYVAIDATENKDTAFFRVLQGFRRLVEFAAVENKDTAEFIISARNLVEFSAAESKDTASFSIDARTQVYIDAIEKRDIASFRTFAAFFTDGDTDFIHLQPELRTAIVPPQIDRAAVPYSMRASVPSENQRINVAQTQLQRKARE
jgi:hypothetical protein